MKIADKTRIKYVEKSFENKPSFLIEEEPGKEWISNGCVFVENTPDNRQYLIDEFDCEEYLDELLNAHWGTMADVVNGRSMFKGCLSLTSFELNLSNLKDGSDMFVNCSSLTSFDVNMPRLENGWGMFDNCSSLTSLNANMPKLENGEWMFRNCSSLTSFDADLPNLKCGTRMFWGCSSLTSLYVSNTKIDVKNKLN